MRLYDLNTDAFGLNCYLKCPIKIIQYLYFTNLKMVDNTTVTASKVSFPSLTI